MIVESPSKEIINYVLIQAFSKEICCVIYVVLCLRVCPFCYLDELRES